MSLVRTPLTDAQKRLAERYIPLALSIAKRRNLRWMKIGGNDEIHEMRSAATEGLCDAAAVFDPGQGTHFAMFARPRIIGSVINFELAFLGRSRPDRPHRKRFRDLCPGSERRGRVMFAHRQPNAVDHLESAEAFEFELRRLPEKHATLMRHMVLGDCTASEAASLMGLSKSYVSRIKDAALAMLGPRVAVG